MSIRRITVVEPYLCNQRTTVRECMARIDSLGRATNEGRPFQFLLVTDDMGRIVGTLTDGDIRRGILAGRGLDDDAGSIAFRTPRIGTAGEDRKNREILAALLPASTFLPIVNTERRVIEILVALADQHGEVLALIMAGGFGRRLGDRTRHTPKPLLPIGDRPILAHVIDRISAARPTRIYVSTHYLAHRIEEFVAAREDRDRIAIIREPSPLGTAGCVGLLDDPLPHPLIVANGDILTRLDFAAFARFYFHQSVDALVAVAQHRTTIPFGVIRSNAEGGLLKIDEKPTLTHFIAAGIYVLAPIFRSLVAPGEAIDMPALIERGQQRGLRVALFALHEDWTDIGRPEDLTRAESAPADANVSSPEHGRS